MKRKKLTSEPIILSSECPGCGLASESDGQFCHSCAGTHQKLADIALKRSAMIRYARMHFYDAVCLYSLWLLDNKRQRVIRRGKVIDD